jgi:hypothetical protein
MTVVTWLTQNVAETSARFRDRLGFHVEEPDDPAAADPSPAAAEHTTARATIRLGNALIDVVGAPDRTDQADGPAPRAQPGRRSPASAVPGERLQEVVRADRPESDAPRPVHPNGAAGLLAIGWSTVDHERASMSRSGVRFVFAGLDPLLGSAAWIATALSSGGPSTTRDSPAELLLEPAREGPLAAALARFGEGPVALYVRIVASRWDALHAELARRGSTLRGPISLPLGDAYLVRPERPWGPFLLFVRVPSAGGAEGSHRKAGA